MGGRAIDGVTVLDLSVLQIKVMADLVDAIEEIRDGQGSDPVLSYRRRRFVVDVVREVSEILTAHNTELARQRGIVEGVLRTWPDAVADDPGRAVTALAAALEFTLGLLSDHTDAILALAQHVELVDQAPQRQNEATDAVPESR